MTRRCVGLKRNRSRRITYMDMAACVYLYIVKFKHLFHKARWGMRWSKETFSFVFSYSPPYFLHGACFSPVRSSRSFFFSVNFYIVWHVYKAIAWSFVLLVYLRVCVWRTKREIWRAFSFNSFVYASMLDANQYLTCVHKILAAKHFFTTPLHYIQYNGDRVLT